MNLRDTLTKENFWNATMEQYPKATKLFCDWIDDYKKAVNWNKLFNDSYSQSNIKRASNGEIYSMDLSTPKFHDLPYDIQAGIWMRFVNDTLSDFFEQPEYEYSFDLEEDIKIVFSEIESLIDEQ